MKRRDFIGWSSSAALLSLLEIHPALAAGEVSKGDNAATAPRIAELHLLTTASMPVLRRFYAQSLLQSIVHETGKELVVQAGQTRIHFYRVEPGVTPPFYHVAFNIPENKIVQALEWQKMHTEILATPDNMIDPRFPSQVRHFRNWNAHSIFFWDPAGNLLEYIARHDLMNPSTGKFSGSDVLCASEIAYIVDDVDQTAADIRSALNWHEYKDGSENFRAIGDEMGLLLIMKRGRVWMSNTGTPKTPSVFETRTIVRGGTATWAPAGYPYQVSVQG